VPPSCRSAYRRPPLNLTPPPQLRRELASALRDITQLLGLGTMLHYMLQLLRTCFAQLGPPAGANGASAPAHAAGSGVAGGGGAANSPGGAPAWVALESVLYAANVVVGRRAPEVDPASVLQLLQVHGAARRLCGSGA
jgi:hypothetical protein